MKKLLSLLLVSLLLLSFAACGDKRTDMGNDTTADNTSQTGAPSKATSLTVLSASPELSGALEEIAAAYRAKTGVTLQVQSQPKETYRNTLLAALDRENAPVLFALTNDEDLAAIGDKSADLQGTALATFLADKSLALTDNGKLLAIPVDVTAYGLLYNKAVTDRYFALKDKKTSYASMDEITDYAKFKALVTDLAAHKQELGIDAVFADLPLGADGDWLSHASSAAVYADVKDQDSLLTRAVRSLKDFAFSVGDKIEDAFDLLFDNTVSGRKKLDTVTETDALREFATGKTAFLYTGSDSYDKLRKVEGRVLKDEDLHFLPLYLGLDGEDAMGLTVDATHYLAVNDKASDAQKQAAVDFLEWLFSAEDGKRFVKENLGFLSPFNTFKEGELSDDPLKTETLRHLTKDGEAAIPDLSRAYPGGTFRTDVGGSLLQYTRGEKGWDDFVSDVKTMWNRAVQAGKEMLQVD